ncbi:hypothetical protein AM1_3363 [Acaryochloris marina MBIC11017]|uniref:Uncharacterized protein n=1 Tax=Acaryochloris marina (strain MBIC 11017) TaxID=329726 RepID=B0C010_ACAM1|nr:hypothetical protein AM1_3363 [Acaryochloris marina MBIC11017]
MAIPYLRHWVMLAETMRTKCLEYTQCLIFSNDLPYRGFNL